MNAAAFACGFTDGRHLRAGRMPHPFPQQPEVHLEASDTVEMLCSCRQTQSWEADGCSVAQHHIRSVCFGLKLEMSRS